MGIDVEQLIDSLQERLDPHGFTDKETEHAARRCVMHMAVNGAIGYGAGAVAGYFLSLGTASIPLAVAGGAAGAGKALLEDANCDPVRRRMGIQDAVDFWNKTSPNDSQKSD